MIVRWSVTPVGTNVAQLTVFGGYVGSLHLTSGAVSWITTFPVALSTVYVCVSAGKPPAFELTKNAWYEGYAFAPSTWTSERVGAVEAAGPGRPALQKNVVVVSVYAAS